MPKEEKKFGDELRSATDYLAYEQALPSGASEDGNGGAGLIGNVQGALEVVARTSDDIALTGDLTIKLQASETEDGTYADVPGASVTISNPSEDGGVDLARFAIESYVGPWIKVVLTTSAAPATAGGVNVFPVYLSR